MPENADNAFRALDGTIFKGKMFPAKSKDDEIPEEDVQAGSSYKNEKENKQKKTGDMSPILSSGMASRGRRRHLNLHVKETAESASKKGNGSKLLVRNVPFQATQDEITDLFKTFGELKAVRLPKKMTGRGEHRGFGFIDYYTESDAKKAFDTLSKSTHLYGRRLVIEWASQDETIDDLRAKSARLASVSKDAGNRREDEGSTKKQLAAYCVPPAPQKNNAGNTLSWKSMFLGLPESTLTTLEEGDNQKKAQKFLKKKGVCLEAFDSSDKNAEHSRTVMLVKNLPANTSANDLKQLFLKHGVINRIILPPSGVTAIVEFAEPAEARAAFQDSPYLEKRNTFLHLEWAPIGVFACPADAKTMLQLKADAKSIAETEERSKQENVEPVTKIMSQTEEFEPVDENAVPELDTTLFVKNLNFKTEENLLKRHFIQCGPVYAATVARKKDPSNPDVLLSMDFGFVQYYRTKDASRALTTLNGTMLENHILELKPSTRTLVKETAESASKKGNGSKLLVRNVPFQATQDEITDLFKRFGKLKGVRLIKKVDDGGELRGFGFIDYYKESDAKKALDTLSNNFYLYGRRLVIEWASQDETIEDLRKKTARLILEMVRGID